MPPRWPRQPDRADPAFRRLDDRMNFAVHVAIFAACNSGLWFFRVLGTTPELNVPGGLPGTPLITEIWGLILFAHTVFLFAIARYPARTLTADAGTGFQPKSTQKATKSSKR